MVFGNKKEKTLDQNATDAITETTVDIAYNSFMNGDNSSENAYKAHIIRVTKKLHESLVIDDKTKDQEADSMNFLAKTEGIRKMWGERRYNAPDMSPLGRAAKNAALLEEDVYFEKDKDKIIDTLHLTKSSIKIREAMKRGVKDCLENHYMK